MTQALLSISKILIGGDDIAIKLWSEVIIDILSNVMPLFLGGFSTQSKLMLFHTFSKIERSMVIKDISINTEVWNWVVNLVTSLLLFMFVLITTSGGANWVRARLSLNKVWSNGLGRGNGQYSHTRCFLEHFYYKYNVLKQQYNINLSKFNRK